MAQTTDGARKVAAKRAGVTLDEYLARSQRGDKWCYACRAWHPVSQFGIDASRFDGLTSICKTARSTTSKARYQPKPGPLPGRRYASARDEDRKQARGRVNHLMRVGKLPYPNRVPCVDCGHVWSPGDRRHEFDHHLGYDHDHHETVEIVCTVCHARRESERVKQPRTRDSLGRFAAEDRNGKQ